jgi:uncharacterized protein YjbI with pentapeptide repeats
VLSCTPSLRERTVHTGSVVGQRAHVTVALGTNPHHYVLVAIVWRKKDRAARAHVMSVDDLSGQDLSRYRLHDLDLRGKNFAGANLDRADLTACDLRGVNLSGANLFAAFLTGAQLDGADLRNACLDGAYLIATEFLSARMDGVTVVGATWDQATVWPPDFRPPKTDAGLWHGIGN